MNGKFYLFYAIQCNHPEFDIDASDFDEYQWLTFADAYELAQNIYQRGKRRITVHALELLRQNKLI